MCGVFGYVAKQGREMDVKRIKAIAKITESRGRHAWGLAWIDRNGRLKMFKQRGKISDSLGLLSIARDARMLIGHTRWATQGDPANNLNNHPHPVDGGWFVHNGMLPEYRELILRRDLYPVTDCDSEVLGLMMEDADGSLVERMRESITATHPGNPLVMLGIWSRPRRVLAARRGNPLSIGEDETGHYFASYGESLPGAQEVEDDSILEFTRETLQSYPIYLNGKPGGGSRPIPATRPIKVAKAKKTRQVTAELPF